MSEFFEAATWLVYVIVALLVFNAVLVAIFVPFWIKRWRQIGRDMDEMEERIRKRRL